MIGYQVPGIGCVGLKVTFRYLSGKEGGLAPALRCPSSILKKIKHLSIPFEGYWRSGMNCIIRVITKERGQALLPYLRGNESSPSIRRTRDLAPFFTNKYSSALSAAPPDRSHSTPHEHRTARLLLLRLVTRNNAFDIQSGRGSQAR